MASLRVLAFDHDGRLVAFDTWHDDLQLYLLSDIKDSVSLFDHVYGVAPAPPATADVSTCSQWLSRDATARLAIRNHLSVAECTHFGQQRTAQAQYVAVVARYSSPATAALGRLLLPYLFPELSAFDIVADLVTHLRTSDARYCATVSAEFLATNQPTMFITLYFIVSCLPDSLRSVRDHFLSLDPTSLTADLLEQHLLAAETSAAAIGAARGTPRPPFFEGCSPSPLSPSFAYAASADVSVPEDAGAASTSASAAAARARVAGVVEVAAVVVEVAVGAGVGAAVEVVEAEEVVAAVGLVAAVGALVAAVEAAEGVEAVEAMGLVVAGLDLSVEALVVVSDSSSSVGARPSRPSSSTCGKFHTKHRCFSRLDDAWRAEFGDDVERPRLTDLLRSGVAIFDLDCDAIISAMYALSFNAEGDCYRCVPPDPGIAAAALGASASGTPPGTAPAEALHTFTLDSGTSCCFFRDSTALTPLPAPVPVRLADPSGGPVVASSSTVLPCLAVPSGSLSGLHLPLFSTNMVSTAALQDGMVTTTTPGGQRVSTCTCTRMGRHLATFTRRPGWILYTLATGPPRVTASAQVSATGHIAASCLCRLLSHQTLLWHHRLCHPSLPRLRGMHSRFLVSGLPRSLPPLPPSPAPPCLPCVEGRQRAAPHSSSFPPMTTPLQTLQMDVWGVKIRFGTDLPVLRLHSDRGGEFSSDLSRDFCRGEGITQSFTLLDYPQQNGIAERRIGLVMEVARTSMIHAAAPHFLWPFAARYAAHQLNLWHRVSLLETLPTLRWMGKVGDASVFRDVTFDELVPFYRLFPYHSAPPPPPPLFLAPGPPPVDPLPPQGPAPSGVSQVDPLRGTAPVEVAVSSSAAPDAASGGAASKGAEPGGAGSEGAGSGGAEPGGAEPKGVEPRGPAGASPRVSPQQLREWLVRRAHHRSEAPEAGGAGDTGAGGADVTTGAGGTGVTAATSPGGARTSGGGAAGTGGVGCTGAGDPTEPRAAGAGGARAGGAGVGGCGAGGAGVAGAGVGGTGAGAAGTGALDPGTGGLPRPFLCPLPAPSPYTEQSGSLTERREPASFPVSPVHTAHRAPRSRPPPVLGTNAMALRPSSVPLPAPPESSLPEVPDPASDCARAANPTVSHLLATAVTDPSFESAAASALVAELLDFEYACRLDYATALVTESVSASPPFVGGECALGTDVLEDRQEDFKCLAAAVPRFASMLLAPEGDPDALDIPTPRSYAEAITGPYSSQWQAAMDAEMASWKSKGTYVDEFPPSRANIVDGMWIFRVKRPLGSPPAFKARYIARGFSQRQGVDYFHTFSPTPKMTTLRVLLHVASQCDYELHSLNFSTAFLQGSLHEEILLQWHDTLRTTLAALRFAPSTADPSLFLRTDTSLLPFYVLVYVDDLVFATTDTEALAHVKSELQKRHTCTDLGELRSYLGLQITRDRARRTITLTLSHMVHQLLQRFGFLFSFPQPTPLSTSHSLSAPRSDESVEPSGPYLELVGCLIMSGMGLVLGGRGPVVLTGHADASWVDDSATQRSSQGYTFSLGSGSVSWWSTRLSSVLSSSCEAEIYAGAMAAQELRWLTYLLTDLGEKPRSPPVVYVDSKAMIALCQEHRLEHRTKHIALRYFLARELQQHGQLRLAYNTLPSALPTLPRIFPASPLARSKHTCVAARAAFATRAAAPMYAVTARTYSSSRAHMRPRTAAQVESHLPGLGPFPAARVETCLSSLGACVVSSPRASERLCVGSAATTSLAPALVAGSGATSQTAQLFFTLDSGASSCFFRDCIDLTPLRTPVTVALADLCVGPVVAHSTTTLPCPADPSRFVIGYYTPSFSRNLVGVSPLHDLGVVTTFPLDEHVASCTVGATGAPLATFHREPGSGLFSLHTGSHHTESSQVRSCQVADVSCDCLPASLTPIPRSHALTCSPCIEGRQRAAPHSSSFPPTTAPFQTLHLDVWGPSPVLGPRQERYFLIVVDEYSRYTTSSPLQRPFLVVSGGAGGAVAEGDGPVVSSRRPRPASPPGFSSIPRLPSCSSLRPVAAKPGGVPMGGNGGPGGVGGGDAGSGGARAGGTGTVGPTPRTVRFLTREHRLLWLEREERERGLVILPSVVLCLQSPSSLTVLHDLLSDYLRASRPVVSHVLSTLVTHLTAPLSSVSALVTTVAGFASSHRLDYASHLVRGTTHSPSTRGVPVFPLEDLEDRQFELGFLAATVPHLCAMLLALEGDTDALDIPIPRTHTKAVLGPWASYWIAAEEAEMAFYRSTCTYVGAVPPPGTNVSARGGRLLPDLRSHPKDDHSSGVHIADQRDYEIHSLDFSTAFLQGSLHEQTWLSRPPGFTDSFPLGTQWQLRRPVHGLRQAPRELHDTIRTTLAALDFFPSSADPSMFVRRGSTPFLVLIYVDDLVFATPDRRALASVEEELQRRHTCTDLGELQHYLGLQITRDRAARTITLTQSRMVEWILMWFRFPFSKVQLTPLAVDHELTASPSDESFESNGPYCELVGCLMYLMTCTRPDLAYPLSVLARFFAPGRHRPSHWYAAKRVAKYVASTSGMGLVLGGKPVTLTAFSDSLWADDADSLWSTQGYCFSLGTGVVSWRLTRASFVSSSSSEAEVYVAAMAAQEFGWLSFLLTDLGERPRSPPVFFADNRSAILLCEEP
ncbi:unnamed protein product [Closterium sp. NIES-53]